MLLCACRGLLPRANGQQKAVFRSLCTRFMTSGSQQAAFGYDMEVLFMLMLRVMVAHQSPLLKMILAFWWRVQGRVYPIVYPHGRAVYRIVLVEIREFSC